jgi:hypothetical protein
MALGRRRGHTMVAKKKMRLHKNPAKIINLGSSCATNAPPKICKAPKMINDAAPETVADDAESGTAEGINSVNTSFTRILHTSSAHLNNVRRDIITK